jgi:glycogen phosphorylase
LTDREKEKESFSDAKSESLNAFHEISFNLYWTWDRQVARVFELIDTAAWEGVGHNPVLLLRNVPSSRLNELSRDDDFVATLMESRDIQRRYLAREDTWFRRKYGTSRENDLVAYFSAEFGIAPFLRIYSGGLGVLSGDHLKSASDLGVPVIGVGLFYKRGYFSQAISHDSRQMESYPANEPHDLPIEQVSDPNSHEPLIISIPLAEKQLRVMAWRVHVGRVDLLLLDTNLPHLNSKEDCAITGELYGGDAETRIKQEIVLGFGGSKMLRALGIKPSFYHLNEGHAAFATVERIGEIMEDWSGVSFSKAKEIVKATTLFTTHTPVAAGIDIFPNHLVERYLTGFCNKYGISLKEVLPLGEEHPGSGTFNMAALAIHESTSVNAVSKLHEHIAGKMWRHLFESAAKGGDAEHYRSHKVRSVTNGIHIRSWISESMDNIYNKYLGRDWAENTLNLELWLGVRALSERLLWDAHCVEKAKLIDFIKRNFSFPGYKHPIERILDPSALTIGFARRFATYKRGSLLLFDKERLIRLLKDTSRPIQIIFSGKAHPKDSESKAIIHELVEFARGESSEGRVVFLPDYDISIAKRLVQGVDLWLNNPRRPLEASGTSGMKVAANGGLNMSVLDGWWDEAYSPSCGWAIGSRTVHADAKEQDRIDAESLYNLLESEVIPEFYDRKNGLPEKWIEKMKNSISTLAPMYSTMRMLNEYATRFYFNGALGE